MIFTISILFISCNQISEEDTLVHNQKVISGINKKKADLDKILFRIDQKIESANKEFENVNTYKLFRSAEKKRRQLAAVQKKFKVLRAYKDRTEKLKSQLDLTHKTFEWQSHPKKVLEKVFEIANKQIYGEAIFLADPYDENDANVDRVAFIACHPKEFKDQFIKSFKNGRIIGEPVINSSSAQIEFLFGKNADRKETMKFVKRKDSWYLSSF